MWIILGIVGFSSLIGLLEIPKLLRENQKKEIWVFSSILIISTTLAILKAQEIHIPNPLIGIQSIYEPIGEYILKKYAP